MGLIDKHSYRFATQKNVHKELALPHDELDEFLGTITFMSLFQEVSYFGWRSPDMMPSDRCESNLAKLAFKKVTTSHRPMAHTRIVFSKVHL